MFSDGQVWANSVDADQTAPGGVYCLSFCLPLLGELVYDNHIIQIER